MVDPLYEEIITNISDLMGYVFQPVFIEFVLTLSIFVAAMLTIYVDWTWIPILSFERKRVHSLEEVKRYILENVES